MRRWTVITLFFFLLNLSTYFAFAKTIIGDTTKHNSGFRDESTLRNYYKTLVVVNDKVYHADFKSIDPANISVVQVFWGASASAIYGSQADSCVLSIYTKDYHKAFFKVATQTKAPLTAGMLYILDGFISDKNLNGVKPDEIFSRDSISRVKVVELPNKHTKNGLVVVLTKRAAVISYQNKLSQFSKEYKVHLDADKNDDSQVVFIIDAVFYSPTKNEGIKRLFQLDASQIDKVKFSKREENAAGWKPATVFITTKQN